MGKCGKNNKCKKQAKAMARICKNEKQACAQAAKEVKPALVRVHADRA